MATPDALRILLSMRNFWYVRVFESVVRALAARGHQVHILVGHDPDPTHQWTPAADALVASSPNITMSHARRSIDDGWLDLRLMLRLGSDYLRFLQPQYAAAPILALRARSRVPDRVRALAEYDGPGHRLLRRLMRRALRAAERAIPADLAIESAVMAHKADLVLVTPLIDLGSYQHDVVRVSRRMAIPTAVCVGSWDHLSSKALIREQPDAVFVWNETQKREAVTMHGVPAERVTVTGAQCFDQWFDRKATLARDEFCRKVGLDGARPFVLYVCSALFEGSPNEAAFVQRWLAAVRSSSHPRLRTAGILIRPHPKRSFEWDAVDLSAFDNVALWPHRGTAPMNVDTQADYFDSLFHSAAVVGLNTSAQIEAGIAGRAVHTLLLPEFLENQEGTLHFHYLLDGGLLRAARDLPGHVVQLEASVEASDPVVQQNGAFLEAFVRPHGLGVNATETFVNAVERLADIETVPLRDPAWAPALRVALGPLASRTAGTFVESLGRQRRYRDKQVESDARTAALQVQRAEEKARIALERRMRREAETRERDLRVARDRQAKLAAKERVRGTKAQAKEQRTREKHRRALKERLAGYCRRIVRPSSASR
ncbi:MAG: hypothetical protein ABL993_09900 [Vicinamibacterales bacterium]